MNPHEERTALAASRLPRPRTPLAQVARSTELDGTPVRLRKLVIVGRRGLGPALARRAADAGYLVTGLEPEPAFGPWARAVSAGRAEALERFDVAVIDVAWSPDASEPDLSSLAASADSVARFLLPGAMVIVASPTVADTVADALQLVAHVLERGSRLTPGVDFHLGALTSHDADTSQHRLFGISVAVLATTARTYVEIERFLTGLTDETVGRTP